MSGRRVRPAGHPSAFDNEEIASLAPHRAATSQGHATGVVHLAVGAVQRDDGGVGVDLFTVRQRLRPTGTARVVAFESTTVVARIHAIRVNRSMWHRLGIAVAARVMLRPDEPFLGHLGAVAFEKAQDATEYQVAHVIAADERVLLIVAVRIEMFDGSDDAGIGCILNEAILDCVRPHRTECECEHYQIVVIGGVRPEVLGRGVGVRILGNITEVLLAVGALLERIRVDPATRAFVKQAFGSIIDNGFEFHG